VVSRAALSRTKRPSNRADLLGSSQFENFHHCTIAARLGHMLRHACGYKLANDGQDTRALQHYLGHKNIQHTVRYTELAADRFKGFWKD
jgi:site-specific recombinase XerD